jgi:hypothetical protein
MKRGIAAAAIMLGLLADTSTAEPQACVIREFSGYYKHLELAAGPHLVTIIAPNYEPLTIPVLVSPGHTLTYRGTLTRAHGR